MHRFPAPPSRFMPMSGVIANPCIGFTSFRHFRGDPLCSDRMPGHTVLHLSLPEGIPAGHYALEVGIGTGEPGCPVVKPAMTAPNDGT